MSSNKNYTRTEIGYTTIFEKNKKKNKMSKKKNKKHGHNNNGGEWRWDEDKQDFRKDSWKSSSKHGGFSWGGKKHHSFDYDDDETAQLYGIKDFPALYEKFKQIPQYNSLTPSQKKFVEIFFTTGSDAIFCTGGAGVGKSYITKILIDFLIREKVAVGKTASTGVASILIGGSTLHSFLGIGLAKEDESALEQKVRRNKNAKARIKAMVVLVIDEISMIKGGLLDKCETIIRRIRSKNEAFGGVKVLYTGDCLQLPPIWNGDDNDGSFFFQSDAWINANTHTVELNEIVRQEKDPKFAKLLGRIRIGDVSDMSLLKTRIGAKFENDSIEPVRIFCKNIDVDEFNRKRLAQIKSPSRFFEAEDFGQDYQIEQLNKNCLAPKMLELKIGAAVMVLKNYPQLGLVNGSVGTVSAFEPNGIFVDFKHGRFLIEKDKWEILEQRPKLGGTGFSYSAVASRTQYPLKLSYSITAHKAQGATLERVIIDMGEAFASGQVYVALSRVRNLESMSITSCPTGRIKVDPDCLDFYRQIEKTGKYVRPHYMDEIPIEQNEDDLGGETYIDDDKGNGGGLGEML